MDQGGNKRDAGCTQILKSKRLKGEAGGAAQRPHRLREVVEGEPRGLDVFAPLLLLKDELIFKDLLNVLLEGPEALCDHTAVVFGSLRKRKRKTREQAISRDGVDRGAGARF